jgi:hypothetical protein
METIETLPKVAFSRGDVGLTSTAIAVRKERNLKLTTHCYYSDQAVIRCTLLVPPPLCRSTSLPEAPICSLHSGEVCIQSTAHHLLFRLRFRRERRVLRHDIVHISCLGLLLSIHSLMYSRIKRIVPPNTHACSPSQSYVSSVSCRSQSASCE